MTSNVRRKHGLKPIYNDMTGFYVYDEDGNQIAYVRAADLLEAYKEAEYITGLTSDDIYVERS